MLYSRCSKTCGYIGVLKREKTLGMLVAVDLLYRTCQAANNKVKYLDSMKTVVVPRVRQNTRAGEGDLNLPNLEIKSVTTPCLQT